MTKEITASIIYLILVTKECHNKNTNL